MLLSRLHSWGTDTISLVDQVLYLSTHLRYLYFTSVFSSHCFFYFYSEETQYFLLHYICLTALVTLQIRERFYYFIDFVLIKYALL